MRISILLCVALVSMTARGGELFDMGKIAEIRKELKAIERDTSLTGFARTIKRDKCMKGAGESIKGKVYTFRFILTDVSSPNGNRLMVKGHDEGKTVRVVCEAGAAFADTCLELKPGEKISAIGTVTGFGMNYASIYIGKTTALSKGWGRISRPKSGGDSSSEPEAPSGPTTVKTKDGRTIEARKVEAYEDAFSKKSMLKIVTKSGTIERLEAEGVEVIRPGADIESRKAELRRRIRALEAELAALETKE